MEWVKCSAARAGAERDAVGPLGGGQRWVVLLFQVPVGQASVTPESSCGVVDPCARRRFVQLLRRSRMAGCLLGELYP